MPIGAHDDDPSLYTGDMIRFVAEGIVGDEPDEVVARRLEERLPYVAMLGTDLRDVESGFGTGVVKLGDRLVGVLSQGGLRAVTDLALRFWHR